MNSAKKGEVAVSILWLQLDPALSKYYIAQKTCFNCKAVINQIIEGKFGMKSEKNDAVHTIQCPDYYLQRLCSFYTANLNRHSVKSGFYIRMGQIQVIIFLYLSSCWKRFSWTKKKFNWIKFPNSLLSWQNRIVKLLKKLFIKILIRLYFG